MVAAFPKEMEQFRGKHVAISGRMVVASGDSAKEVFEKARKDYLSGEDASFSFHSEKRSIDISALGVSL